jgi:hypothetical protein
MVLLGIILVKWELRINDLVYHLSPRAVDGVSSQGIVMIQMKYGLWDWVSYISIIRFERTYVSISMLLGWDQEPLALWEMFYNLGSSK